MIGSSFGFFKRILDRHPNFLKPMLSEHVGYRENVSDAVFGYKKFIEKKDYIIFKRNMAGKKIVAANESIVVVQNLMFNKNTIYIYPNYRNRLYKYKVKFNELNFPGLISGSLIISCYLLPFIREVAANQYSNKWRLVVVTDKSQIFHNFPNRNKDNDGYEQNGDITNFEESVIWDVPGHKYPVSKETFDEREIFMPCLPKEVYTHHPMVNTDSTYSNKYGHSGFGQFTNVTHHGEAVSVTRFYFPLRNIQGNSFYCMGGFEADYKMSLIGTYRANNDSGVRTVIFATSDGGRQWYAKYEFGDTGEYLFRQGDQTLWGHNFGNPIDTSDIESDYVKSSFNLHKRTVISPSASNKEPNKIFTWDNPICVERISREKVAIVKTTDPHGLETGNIIVMCSAEINNSSGWNWMVNNNISEASSGNGLMFKVEVIDPLNFKLHEFVASANNNITCCHIHHINRIKDGWIIGTGEIYPNGWVLYMQMKEADTYSLINAADELKIIRLNSSEESVQRTLGGIMYDDLDSTMIFALDHDKLPRNETIMPEGRTESFDRNSTGIYKGLLRNIDDFKTFQPIFEAKEPAYFFKELGRALVYSGQRGEFAISFDQGKTWSQEHLKDSMYKYYGKTYGFYVINDFILLYK